MGRKLDILIIDDHPLFRDALALAVEKASSGQANIAQAGSLNEALEHLKNTRPDLVLLDLNMSDSTDFDGLSKIQIASDKADIIVVSATETQQAYTTAQSLGAKGYIPKSAALDDMAQAISTVMTGNTSFPNLSELETDKNNDAAEKLSSLTPAQQKVMSCLSDGLLNKQIAYEMGISEATVKAHMTAIFRKLGANNRTQALLIYRDATLL